MAELQTKDVKEGSTGSMHVDKCEPAPAPLAGLTIEEEQFLASFSTKDANKIYRKVCHYNRLRATTNRIKGGLAPGPCIDYPLSARLDRQSQYRFVASHIPGIPPNLPVMESILTTRDRKCKD